MTAISFVLHIQHARVLSDYRLSHIGSGASYWDVASTNQSFTARSERLYWPLVRMLKTSIKKNPQAVHVTLSLGGSFLELCQANDPALFAALQELVELPNISLACTPLHGGLSFMSTDAEFKDNLQAQRKSLRTLFKKDASIVHLPHLLYSDYAGKLMAEAGFSAAITDGWDPVLPGDRNANHAFHHPENAVFKILASNYGFTEDFNRYCERTNKHHFAVSPERYVTWLNKTASKHDSEVITAFLDLTGPGAENSEVLCFLSDVFNLLAQRNNVAMISAEAASRKPSCGAIRSTTLISNSLPGHDATRWMGSALQQELLEKLNAVSSRIRRQQGNLLLDAWRHLFAINHFADLHIRHYTEDADDFGHAPNPYDVSLSLFNILEDLELALAAIERGEHPAMQTPRQQSERFATGSSAQSPH